MTGRVFQMIETLTSLVECDHCRRPQLLRCGLFGFERGPVGCLYCGHFYGTYTKEQG